MITDSNAKSALPIKDIVNKVILGLSSDESKQDRLSEEDIKKLWRKAAGKLAGQRSKPISLRKGKLVVNVEDSSLLYDLTLRKREILKELSKGLKDKIQDIQFRIGETSEEGKNAKRKTQGAKRT